MFVPLDEMLLVAYMEGGGIRAGGGLVFSGVKWVTDIGAVVLLNQRNLIETDRTMEIEDYLAD